MKTALVAGRLTSTPELRYTSGASPLAVCNALLLTEPQFAKDKAEYLPINFFGKLAEDFSRAAQKGDLVFVEGRLTSRQRQGNNGTNFFNIEIAAKSFLVQRDQVVTFPQSSPPVDDVPNNWNDQIPF